MTSPSSLSTSWLITSIPGFGRLQVTVTVDTRAPSVLRAIEEAAEQNEIVLVRLT